MKSEICRRIERTAWKIRYERTAYADMVRIRNCRTKMKTYECRISFNGDMTCSRIVSCVSSE